MIDFPKDFIVDPSNYFYTLAISSRIKASSSSFCPFEGNNSPSCAKSYFVLKSLSTLLDIAYVVNKHTKLLRDRNFLSEWGSSRQSGGGKCVSQASIGRQGR